MELTRTSAPRTVTSHEAKTPMLDAGEVTGRACARIAPTWPLDRFIAVNPFWGRIGTPFPEVSAELGALSGARLLMPRAWYRDAFREGRVCAEHLSAAIVEAGSSATVRGLLALLETEEPPLVRRARVMDVADASRADVHEMSWRDFVVSHTSQLCASYFDDGQAQIRAPREGGLYATFCRHAPDDRSPPLLMGLRSYRDLARELPATPREMIALALADLDVPVVEREAYLTSLLLDLNGWASWCSYLRWTARLAGGDDDTITDLLAVRLAWEWLLHRAGGPAFSLRWKLAIAGWGAVSAAARASQEDDWLLQRAVEIGWQEGLCRALPEGRAPQAPEAPAAPEAVCVQAVFCIDVRSEVFRRALETEAASVQTLGFAGFFGLPVAYQPLGAAEARPHLPGLLAPWLRVTDTGAPAGAADRRRESLDAATGWGAFKAGVVSTFAFVEALGLTYAAHLIADSFGLGESQSADGAGQSRDARGRTRPRLTGTLDGEPLGADARSDLAAGMLRAMSLTHDFARIVLLVGHGSETRNNPHAAGLDCGACCGQTGEVSARAAAGLLNDPEVRAGLAARGIHVPETTRFLAALHHTTTDEVTLFEAEDLPPSHAADAAALRGWLLGAGARARAERAPALGIAGDRVQLRRAVGERARDWSQVRAEWGLANNAAFIVAPRARTRHLSLEGRAFLHEYRHQEDEGSAVLELILTAPMVVTHWINLQYYASTVDNLRYGSGNKVLHNVVGGHIGVFEGNGGDLRIGLPIQSLHDGERWVHTPLRLSVFVEAPLPAIEAILRKHDHVRALVENGWIHLFQIDPAGVPRPIRRIGDTSLPG